MRTDNSDDTILTATASATATTTLHSHYPYLILRSDESIVTVVPSCDVTLYQPARAVFPDASIICTTHVLIIQPFVSALIEIPLQNIRAIWYSVKKEGLIRRRQKAHLAIRYYIDQSLTSRTLTISSRDIPAMSRLKACLRAIDAAHSHHHQQQQHHHKHDHKHKHEHEHEQQQHQQQHHPIPEGG